jgi:hypothetical protein
VIDATIAPLQSHATVDCLCIVEDRFGLDPDSPHVSSDERIPGATVARDRQRHLRLPANRWMKTAPEALQQPCVPRISDWVTVRVQAKGNNEAEAGRMPDQHPEGDVQSAAALDATDLGLRDPACQLESPLTEARSHAGSAQLSTEAGKRLIRQAITSVARSFSRDHRRSSSCSALYGRFIRLRQRASARDPSPHWLGGPLDGSTVEGATASSMVYPRFPPFPRHLARPAVQESSAPQAKPRFTHRTVHGPRRRSASRTTRQTDERTA